MGKIERWIDKGVMTFLIIILSPFMLIALIVGFTAEKIVDLIEKIEDALDG